MDEDEFAVGLLHRLPTGEWYAPLEFFDTRAEALEYIKANGWELYTVNVDDLALENNEPDRFRFTYLCKE